MENVYKASKTILLFLFIILIIQTVFGDKTAQSMSLMILFSMLVLNADKVATYLSTVTDTLTYEKKTTHGGTGGTF